MSTDIVKFQKDLPDQIYKVYSSAALSLFFEICIPIMFATLVVWLIVYWTLDWRQRRAREASAQPAGDEKV